MASNNFRSKIFQKKHKIDFGVQASWQARYFIEGCVMKACSTMLSYDTLTMLIQIKSKFHTIKLEKNVIFERKHGFKQT